MKKFSLFFISIIFLSCEFILYDLVKEEKPTTVSDNFSKSDTIPNAEGKIITETLNSSLFRVGKKHRHLELTLRTATECLMR